MKKGLISLLTILTIILMSVSLSGCGASTSSKNVVVDEPAPSGSSDAREIKLDFTAETINPNTVEMKSGEKVMFTIKNTDKKEDHNFLDPDGGLRFIPDKRYAGYGQHQANLVPIILLALFTHGLR